jgi:diguanylate cyclase (GGDEF)-like protein
MTFLRRGRTRSAGADPFARRRLTPPQVLLAVFLVGLIVAVEILLWRAYVSAGHRSDTFRRASLTVTNFANLQRETSRLYAESARVAAGKASLDDLALQRMITSRQLKVVKSKYLPQDEIARIEAAIDRYDARTRYLYEGTDLNRKAGAKLLETALDLELLVKRLYSRHEQRFFAQLTAGLRQDARSRQAMLLLGIVVMAIAATLALMLRRSVRSDFQRAYEALVHEVGERKALQGQLEHQAYHDTLTGLANRALFIKRVEEAVASYRRADETVGVIFIDLDDFKTVNDTLGHEAGDALLIEAANRLSRCLRGDDTAARLGGDEFAVLLEQSSDAERVAERILEALRSPMSIAGRDIVVSASVGIAVGGPEITQASTILANADIAMYSAKAEGKSQYALFADTMHEEAETNMRLRGEMQQALQDGQFVLHYQPIIDLDSRECAGAEALVRWNHPQFGVIAPASFIPIAEETGFIRELGRFVLDKATMKAAAWRTPEGTPMSVSVNVSARQLHHADVVSDVTRALERSRLAPELLMLEITETVLMRDPEVVVDKLMQLKKIGVRIAIDDFGTGYSSLSYLKHLPVDTLKIDKTFIDSLEDGPKEAALARAVIEFGTIVGLETVAEGIETVGALKQLVDLHCRYGQGHLLSRPLDETAIEEFIARGSRARPRQTRSMSAPAGDVV